MTAVRLAMLTAVVTTTTSATSRVIRAICRARTPSLSQGEPAGCLIPAASISVARCSCSRALTVVAMSLSDKRQFVAHRTRNVDKLKFVGLTVLFYQTGLAVRLQLVMKRLEADTQCFSGSRFIIFRASEGAEYHSSLNFLEGHADRYHHGVG